AGPHIVTIMKIGRTHRFVLARPAQIVCAATALFVAGEALAPFAGAGGASRDRQTQQDTGSSSGGLRPPVPQRPKDPPRWIYYITVAAMGAAAIGVSILPSKRGHQD
ncbi:MAG: hypothetical protein VYC34_06605, partial [Planctomycetota bacterium]|nr:hypothetical protein [Planctomycetota bacterium]